MSNLEIHVKIYLRNYMQKHSFITMNKKNISKLFVPCIVTVITHKHQQMQTIYIKSQIIHIHELSYVFQQKISVLWDTLIQKNIKLIHQIHIYNVTNK